MARCVGVEPCTVVMDLEGTDGRERGEVCLLAQFNFLVLTFRVAKCNIREILEGYGLGN